MKRRYIISLLVIAALLLGACDKKTETAAAAGSAQAEAIHLRFSDVASDSATLAGQRFKEVTEKETNGSVIVELFLNNILGDNRETIESTSFGDIDIAVSSTSNIAEMYKDFYIFDLSFLFLSPEDAYAKLDGPTGKRILSDMKSIDLKGLCFWENGFRNYTNNKIPAKKPSDFKGVKVRTMENEVHLAAWKAFGANPTPMAFAELFTALQQGTVDAQENPLGVIDTGKFYEVQKFISLTQHVYTPYIVAMNLKKYDSLASAQKAAIDKASAESTTYQREVSQKLEKDILDKYSKTGVTVVNLSSAEKAVFQKIIVDNKILDLVKTKMVHPEYLDSMMAGK
jgi:tripartite ATP-independent transporter DctP family solute receptor